MSETEAFLRQILPSEGLYCAVIFPEKRHHWFDDIGHMAAFLLQQDAAGKTVYHACASYKEKRRKAAFAHLIRCLWLDIDKPDGVALAAFCAAEKIPLPIIVKSGVGWHCYWVLEKELPREEWESYARGFRERAYARGLGFDPPRTADAASILRPPGSHNRKRSEERLVELALQGQGAVPLASLHRGTPHAHKAASSLGPVSLPQYLRRIPILEIGALDEPSDPLAVAANCSQIRVMRDKRGAIEEPLWHASIGALAFCAGGREIIHHWSQGHALYNHRQTDDYIDRAGKNSGPTTCEHFLGLNPVGCAACPYRGKITTPVQLGRGIQGVDHERDRGEIRGHDGVGTGPQEGAEPVLLSPSDSGDGSGVPGFIVPENYGPAPGAGGLYEITRIPGKDASYSVISPQADGELQGFGVIKVCAGRGGQSVVFRLHLPHKASHIFKVSTSDLAGPSVRSIIKKEGPVIADWVKFHEYVDACVLVAWKKGRDMEYDALGWTPTHQLIAGKIMYDDGKETRAELTPRMEAFTKAYSTAGTYATWKEAVKLMLDAECWTQDIALLAGFAAPLMQFTSKINGGTVVAFFSTDTGTGKTMGMKAAASIWGSWKEQTIKSQDTPNARLTKLESTRHFPVFFDDMKIDAFRQGRDKDAIRKFINEFQYGEQKDRNNTKGEPLNPNLITWSTLMLTTANKSLHHSLEGDAMGARILEFRPPPLKLDPQMGANYVEGLFEENYGWAGQLYAKALSLAPPKKFKELIDKAREELTREFPFRKDKHRFWINAFAAMKVAAKIVNTYKILDYDFGPALIRAAHATLASEQAEAIEEQTQRSKIETGQFDDFLRYLMPHTLVIDGQEAFVKNPSRSIHARYEIEDQTLYVAKGVLKDWCLDHGINGRELGTEMAKRKVIVSRPTINLTAGTSLPPSRTQCIKIDLTQLQHLASLFEEHAPQSAPAQAAPSA